MARAAFRCRQGTEKSSFGLLHPRDAASLTLPAPLVSAKNSIYYHITHDLSAGTIKHLNLYAKVFRKIVFICPATYDDFPGASTDPQFTWVPQSSEIPVQEPEKLAGEQEIAGNAVGRFASV